MDYLDGLTANWTGYDVAAIRVDDYKLITNQVRKEGAVAWTKEREERKSAEEAGLSGFCAAVALERSNAHLIRCCLSFLLPYLFTLTATHGICE